MNKMGRDYYVEVWVRDSKTGEATFKNLVTLTVPTGHELVIWLDDRIVHLGETEVEDEAA